MKLIFNKKTLIIFIIVMVIFNTIIPSYSYGFDFGGIIFKPLNTLLITMTDGVNGLLAIFFGGVSELIDFSGDNISNFLASPEYIFANKYLRNESESETVKEAVVKTYKNFFIIIFSSYIL